MENFTAYIPTKVHFGKDVTDQLGNITKQYGQKVLLVYGKGSIKRNGIYQRVMEQLNSINAGVFEYSGIKPNPVVDDVDQAADLGLQQNVDVVLAVGGGSVIDSAKVISLAIANKAAGWKLMKRQTNPKVKIPVISVLTLAATATEMNKMAVLQNDKTHEKFGFGHELNYPEHSFLDPTFTFTVPKDQTAYGVADLIAHTFESFFGGGEAPLSDRFVQAICKVALENGPKVLDEPENYDYRANIMWAATNAMNGICSFGKSQIDAGVHALGHNMSVLFDTPHAATLTIVTPAWLKLQKKRIPERIAWLGKLLFETDSTEATIEKLEAFYQSLKCPVRLSDIGLDNSQKEEYLKLLQKNQASGKVQKLDASDREKIVEYMNQ
ncbi:MAG: iron-containing alcohol dehydrogenase [Bacteroidales bacterium]|nr:iron-containing alcohol dehydrogenase [Bacteroidales bacterium]MBS3774350.1 iron-containing alcohol dehydrogenase [Bacteroidales bacterium]